jgi:hypothetical protein
LPTTSAVPQPKLIHFYDLVDGQMRAGAGMPDHWIQHVLALLLPYRVDEHLHIVWREDILREMSFFRHGEDDTVRD